MSDDLSAAATYGGAGWQPRAAAHAEEVTDGARWAQVGVRRSWDPLRAVVLSEPPESLAFDGPPDAWLMLERPDRARMLDQHAAIAAFFRSRGVEVHVSRAPAPPNYVFMRDLFAATPEGIVLARPAGVQRAGEERWAAATLAQIGAPILRTLRGRGTFEGADLLWFGARGALLGLGRRTNPEGADQVESALREQGIPVRRVQLPPATQHLLGVVVPLDADLVVARSARLTPDISEALDALEVEVIQIPPGEEADRRLGMNLVALGPRDVVMPAGCPGIRGALEAGGVRVAALEVGEYLKAAGGLGCLTGILLRSP